jgi:hypothetical protein
MALPVNKAERDARLDNVKLIANTWFQAEEDRLAAENMVIRKILAARGVSVVAGANLATLASSVDRELDNFFYVVETV